MREIKFRAWDKHHEEMVRVDAIAIERNCFSTKDYIYGSQPHFYDEHNDLHLLEECEIMQYTGLKDKNDKEIYEGDIVTCSNGMAYQYKVIFSFGCFEGYDKASGFTRKLCDMKDLKVIGNIYENPELLKEN